eukprot:982814-Pelagomonas_calceolata.AAC.2
MELQAAYSLATALRLGCLENQMHIKTDDPQGDGPQGRVLPSIQGAPQACGCCSNAAPNYTANGNGAAGNEQHIRLFHTSDSAENDVVAELLCLLVLTTS